MKSNILISTLIMILFLVRCNPKEEKKTNISDIKFNIPQTDLTPPDLVVFEAANSIYGEWVYIDTDQYSKLIINRDGTFRHFNENKIRKSVEGAWTNNGSDYTLLSSVNQNTNSNFNPKKKSLFNKRKIKFQDGFIYEVNEKGSLSDLYYIQTQNYR